MNFHHLKSWSVFILGFGIGFTMTLLFSLIQNPFFDTTPCKKPLKSSNIHGSNTFSKLIVPVRQYDQETVFQHWKKKATLEPDVAYSTWLKNQYLSRNNINTDEYLYGSKEPKGQRNLESRWLKSNVHITCIVFVKKIKLAWSIRNTWGKRCNAVYFFGQQLKDSDIPIINIDVKLISSWQFLCEALNHISKNSTILEWLVIVKDDTVVIPENLRYMVAPINHTADYYFGHPVVMWGQSYNVAQAGYVISKGVFRKLIKEFNNSDKCAAGGKYWKTEDYYLAKHLSTMGIHPSDTRDQYLRGTFHGYSLQNLLWGVIKPGNYWTHALYPVQKECCSPMSVTFSAGEPDKMYTLDYLLYHLFVLKTEGVFGTKRAPLPIPEEDVWKIALKEEFNITNLSEISSDAYYEIWHSKYSAPEELIFKNYQSMPDVLSSVLTSYELESKLLDESAMK